MGFKDLLKDVTDLAKDGLDSIQAEVALRKEEQQRLREAMDRRIKSFTDDLMNQLVDTVETPSHPFINAGDDVLVSYTRDFFEKLLLPANRASSTKIDMYPYDEKVLKHILKTFPTYTVQEKFLFQFKDSKGQLILLTTSNLYFKIVFPENKSFFSIGSIPKEKLFDISINRDEAHFKLLINTIPLITEPLEEVENFDCITLSEYLRRIKTNDFAITNDQVDAFIQLKLDPDTLASVKTLTEADEQLVYFAWGLDRICSKKIVICTDKKIILYDRDLNKSKSFGYEEITSITTQQSTVSFLDLSLTLGMNPNDTEIHTKDFIETIRILYSREANRMIQIYNEHKTADPSEDKHGKSRAEQPAEPQENPLELLEKLAVLKEKGIISEAEFAEKKKELLAKL